MAVTSLESLPGDMLLLVLYHYLPDKNAAIAAVILYALVTVAVAAVTVKTRSWYMLTVVATGLLELTGWGARWAMLNSPHLDTYKLNQCFLVISPVLLAIVEYVTLGKLLAVSAAQQAGDADAGNRSAAGVLAKYVAWLFTISDFICCLLQGSGGALYVNPNKADLARLLLLIGLFAQLCFFSCFIGLLVYVQLSPRYGFRSAKLQQLRPVFHCLYATTLLLHLRNIFRVVEFVQGFAGDLARQEHMLYIFDCVPIYACFLLFTIMHFGFWLGPHAPAMEAAARSQQREKQASSGGVKIDVVHVHCS